MEQAAPNLLSRWQTRALRLLFPPQCLACGAAVETDDGLCGACWRETPFILGLACDSCGLPLPGPDPHGPVQCDGCRATPRPWVRGASVMLYSGTGRQLVLGLKHADRLYLVPALGRWMARRAAALDLAPDTLIAPVPLHWWRLARRRYNQSAELARTIAAETGLAVCPDLLRRARATPSQEGRDREARAQNLAGAIAPNLRRRAAVEGRPVLLVDDVMTSGATLTACTEALAKVSAGPVTILTLAVVPPSP